MAPRYVGYNTVVILFGHAITIVLSGVTHFAARSLQTDTITPPSATSNTDHRERVRYILTVVVHQVVPK